MVSQIWTFLPPETPRSSVLQAYRLEPNAWGDGEDDGIGLAAGWQSPVNLYWRRSDGRGSEAGVSDDGRSFSVPLGDGRCLRLGNPLLRPQVKPLFSDGRR
jgi:hypothetical protein